MYVHVQEYKTVITDDRLPNFTLTLLFICVIHYRLYFFSLKLISKNIIQITLHVGTRFYNILVYS